MGGYFSHVNKGLGPEEKQGGGKKLQVRGIFGRESSRVWILDWVGCERGGWSVTPVSSA